MRASYIRLGAFCLYYAILLLRYFCPNFYLFIFLTISTCGRGLNKNKAKNMQTKRRSLKNTVAKKKNNNNKKRSINVIYLLCNPNRCARWGTHVCVCVWRVWVGLRYCFAQAFTGCTKPKPSRVWAWLVLQINICKIFTWVAAKRCHCAYYS